MLTLAKQRKSLAGWQKGILIKCVKMHGDGKLIILKDFVRNYLQKRQMSRVNAKKIQKNLMGPKNGR